PVPGVRIVEGRASCLREAGKAVVGERLEEVLLGGEVSVDGAHPHAGLAGDLLDSDVEAILGEGLPGGVEDLAAVPPGVRALRRRGLLRARGCSRGGGHPTPELRVSISASPVRHRVTATSGANVITATQPEPKFRIVAEPELSFRLLHRHTQ